jgi:alkanesulfonate monooxygenase SsuD/methylene tetrahydromethanopterin reductase-like flavin-dependent oxidoreductase (luciferase family)
MAKTVDHISGGRLILGIGAGWFERDYDEFGYLFGTAPDRLRALDRNLPIIQRRWETDAPRPLRRIPILIGGEGEKVTLKLAALHADIWNGFGPPDKWRHKNQVLDEWCDKVGRDPSAIERSATVSSPDGLDAFLAVGATHLIMNLSEPWDYAAVEKLVQWRDARR